MALTRSFTETVKARAQADAEFRRELLREALETLLEGDLDVGKAVLRDYINATIGFEALSLVVGTPPKSLHRMLAPRGNPSSANLFGIISALRESEHVRLEVSFADAA
ncbi:MAG: putative transcriptional regulator [Nevskia sp.]|nr:putative transcriptional regulator [Nevskia sp.]